jgi:hypothetical protein
MIINQNVSGGSDPMSLKLKKNANNELVHDPDVTTTIDLTGVQTITDYMLYNAYNSSNVVGTAFRNANNLYYIFEKGACQAFSGCTGITATGLDNLMSVGYSGLESCFYGCTGITSIDVSNISSVEDRGFYGTYAGCSNLTGNISFDSLSSISGRETFYSAFANTNLTSISFPALTDVSPDPDPFNPEDDPETSNQIFSGMLSGVTGCTVHFPSNLEGRFDSWGDFASGFGGTNTTILYDLDPTGEPFEPEPEEPPFEEEPIE